MIPMLNLNRPIGAELGQFFRWWSGELAFLVPTWLRNLFGGNPEFLELVRMGDALKVTHRSGNGESPVGEFSLDYEGRRTRERLFAEKPELAELRTALRLTEGQALRKTLKLPAAVEENLRQVVAFEMDRLTPFKSDQVYFAARVTARTPATRQITVDLVLVPRDKLEALLEDLAAGGWRPEIVDLADSSPPGRYNLLPEKYRPAPSRWPCLVNFSLGGLAVVLVLLLAVLPILVGRSETRALEEQVRKVGKVANEVQVLREDADKLLLQTRFLQDKKRTEPVMVDMLEELSAVIPTNTWLNGLQYKSGRVVIQGQSPSASSLIEQIEASPYFRNTSFVSPVTKDAASNLERFQIASEVVNGRFFENSDAQTVDPEPSDHGR